MKRGVLIFTVLVLLMLNTSSFAFGDTSNTEYETFYQRGLELYEYVLQPVPVALGYPKLSDAEIDELIETNDYRLIQEKISTVADCINYFTRAGFSEDVGSAYEPDTWYKDTSGAQTLMRRGGTCQGMCNCFAYLLRGDYDNLYYVHLDSHSMVIIQEKGVFYLVNPVELQNPEKIKKLWWCDIALEQTICFADSIQEIADSLYNSGITSKFFILDASGDFLPVTLAEVDGETIPCFPKGAEEYVISIYYGEAYHFVDPVTLYGNPYSFDCPDWRTGEYFVPDELVYDSNNPNKRKLDYTLVDSNGKKKKPENGSISLKNGAKRTYSVQFFGKKVTDYKVTVSNKNKASIKKLKNGKFTITRKAKGTFYVKVKYKGITAKYKVTNKAENPSTKAENPSTNIKRDFRLVTSQGYERLTTDTITDLKVRKKATYSVQLVNEHLKDYTVSVSDKNKASVKKLKNGKFTVTAKAKGNFYITVKCKDKNIDEKFKFKVNS